MGLDSRPCSYHDATCHPMPELAGERHAMRRRLRNQPLPPHDSPSMIGFSVGGFPCRSRSVLNYPDNAGALCDIFAV
jgi:hypothetical protein